jgi:hypothetical protein
MDLMDRITELAKALEGGGYGAAPSTLIQGAALQIEDLSTTMHNVCFEDKHLVLAKKLKVESCKSTLAQFDRQLSYGTFGGSAQVEGGIGQEETGDIVRVTVPMAFYSHTRRVTIVANMVATVDGQKAEEREAANAAKKIAGDIEFECFRGAADFSSSGLFDGNPSAVANLPGMHGIDLQIRQSDSQRNARDLMFAEYGSDESVVISVGGTLTQDKIEDAWTRSNMNFGTAEDLTLDPITLSNYNKLAYAKERIVLAGSPQDATGASLAKQWTSGGTVKLAASRFLSAKTKPAQARANGPLPPVSVAPASATDAAAVTLFQINQVYTYAATSCNEVGESVKTAAVAVTIAATGDKVNVVITHPASGVVRYFNVYRTLPGGKAGTEKYIGRVVVAAGASTTTLVDLGNRLPGFVTGFLLQDDTMGMKELAPYSRLKLAVTQLDQPEAHFRFVTLAMFEPRKNVLMDNIT